MILGLTNYGPALYGAYPGAEFLGVVRMSFPGSGDELEPVPDLDEEYAPDTEGDGAGGTPEDVHPSRDHDHRLLVMRTEQMCREAGITPLRSTWQ
jgi:hypothetical protein